MARKKKTVELDREHDIAPGLVAKTKKRLVVAAGRSHPALARGGRGGARHRTRAHRAPHLRLAARSSPASRSRSAAATSSSSRASARRSTSGSWRPLIMLDAAKRASAKRITVVAPYYPYSRQDKKGRGREPISARLVADLLKTAGADRVMSVDLHAAQIQGFFDGPVDHLFAKPVLLEYFEQHPHRRGPRAPHRRLARHRPRARGRHVVRQPRRAARDHPQAPRPERREPGHRQRDRRRTSTAGSACSSTT